MDTVRKVVVYPNEGYSLIVFAHWIQAGRFRVVKVSILSSQKADFECRGGGRGDQAFSYIYRLTAL